MSTLGGLTGAELGVVDDEESTEELSESDAEEDELVELLNQSGERSFTLNQSGGSSVMVLSGLAKLLSDLKAWIGRVTAKVGKVAYSIVEQSTTP